MVPTWALPASIRDDEALARPDEELAFLSEHLEASDVVASTDEWANLIVAALAAQTVVPAWRAPLVGDELARRRATGAVVDLNTPEDARVAILAEYGITHALLSERDPRVPALLGSDGATEIARGRGYLLIKLPARAAK